MAMRVTRRHGNVVVLGSVHPEYRNVLATYLHHLECELVEVPVRHGRVPVEDVAAAVNANTACVIAQQPNFLGGLENMRELAEVAHQAGALFVASCDPISLGLLQRPSEYGADVVVRRRTAARDPHAIRRPVSRPAGVSSGVCAQDAGTADR